MRGPEYVLQVIQQVISEKKPNIKENYGTPNSYYFSDNYRHNSLTGGFWEFILSGPVQGPAQMKRSDFTDSKQALFANFDDEKVAHWSPPFYIVVIAN